MCLIRRWRRTTILLLGVLTIVVGTVSGCDIGSSSDFPQTIYARTDQFKVTGPGVNTTPGEFGECQYTTYIAANSGNSNFKLWANDGCDFGTATPDEANALTNGTQCRFQAVITDPGNNETWGVSSPNWDNFDPCYQTNIPARTLSCAGSGCHGTWQGNSYFDIILPSGYSVQLQGDQAEYCELFASSTVSASDNEMDCVYPIDTTI